MFMDPRPVHRAAPNLRDLDLPPPEEGHGVLEAEQEEGALVGVAGGQLDVDFSKMEARDI